jgi:hypothetical protein
MYSEHDLFQDLRNGNKSTFTHQGLTYGYRRSASGAHTITTEDGRTATTPTADGMLTLRGIAQWMRYSTKTKAATFDRDGNVIQDDRTTPNA